MRASKREVVEGEGVRDFNLPFGAAAMKVFAMEAELAHLAEAGGGDVEQWFAGVEEGSLHCGGDALALVAEFQSVGGGFVSERLTQNIARARLKIAAVFGPPFGDDCGVGPGEIVVVIRRFSRIGGRFVAYRNGRLFQIEIEIGDVSSGDQGEGFAGDA